MSLMFKYRNSGYNLGSLLNIILQMLGSVFPLDQAVIQLPVNSWNKEKPILLWSVLNPS